MVFVGIDNQTVEFRITNYQFPNVTNCEYDSNWLVIYLNVKSNCGDWQTSDPSLMTTDFNRIVKWFNNLSSNNKVGKQLDFLEPNIVFQLLKSTTNKKIVRIIFDWESRPQSAIDDKQYFVDCEMDKEMLRKVVCDLKNEIASFPVRAI